MSNPSPIPRYVLSEELFAILKEPLGLGDERVVRMELVLEVGTPALITVTRLVTSEEGIPAPKPFGPYLLVKEKEASNAT